MYCGYLFPPKGNEMAPSSKGTGTVKQGNDGYDIQCIYIAMGNNMLHVCGLKLVSRDMSPKLILSSISWLWLTDDGILS